MERDPLAALDARTTAVLVVECQNDLVHESNGGRRGVGAALARAAQARGLVPRAARLLAAARGRGVHVIHLTMENIPGFPTPDAPLYSRMRGRRLLERGTWGAEIHPALAPAPGELVIARHLSEDPSYGSGLWATLHALRMETVVVFGVSTNFAVEGTVRAAVNRFFRVVVVEDCCASVPDAWHRFSVENILPLLGTVTTSERLLASWG